MPKTKLHVFDLDNTLVKCNSSYKFCKYLFEKKVFPLSSLLYSAWCYLEHDYLKKTTLKELHQKIFNKLLLGFKLETLKPHIDPFVETVLSQYLYAPAHSLLRLNQHFGRYTVILSNSPSFLVESVARFFNVNEWGATEYAVDKDQKMCHISSLMQGEDKAKFVVRLIQKLGIEKEQVTAYSDSYLDLPFLLSAGTAVAVNPDRKLRQLFSERQWNMI